MYEGAEKKLSSRTLAPLASCFFSFPLSQKHPYPIATFVPEKKDQPAVVDIFELATPDKSIATKSFFRAKEAMLHWCFDGSAVLAHTIDNGEHGLYLVNRGLQSKVILESGAIQLIKWRYTTFAPPLFRFDFSR